MPSWTTPTFSKIEATSQLTQPATFEICQTSGSAVATVPAPIVPSAHSHSPIVAVPASSAEFSSASTTMNAVVVRMCAAIASWCSSIASRTQASSSTSRENSLTVRMLV